MNNLFLFFISQDLDVILHNTQDFSPESAINRDLSIKVIVNKASGTLTIMNNGIAMRKAELLNKFGTITKKKYQQLLWANNINDCELGIYSAYLVADRITVTSKHYKDEQYVLESSADDNHNHNQKR